MSQRKTTGQSLVETMAGFFLFIPLVFMAVDVATLCNMAQKNEQFAESIARVAGTQNDKGAAINIARDAATNYQRSSIVEDVAIEEVTYDLGSGQVTVTTVMTVRMPIPFPYLSEITLRAVALQPIVSMPAPS